HGYTLSHVPSEHPADPYRLLLIDLISPLTLDVAVSIGDQGGPQDLAVFDGLPLATHKPLHDARPLQFANSRKHGEHELALRSVLQGDRGTPHLHSPAPPLPCKDEGVRVV